MRDLEIKSGRTTCHKGKRVVYHEKYRIIYGDDRELGRWFLERRFSCPIANNASSGYGPALRAREIEKGCLCEDCEMMKKAS